MREKRKRVAVLSAGRNLEREREVVILLGDEIEHWCEVRVCVLVSVSKCD